MSKPKAYTAPPATFTFWLKVPSATAAVSDRRAIGPASAEAATSHVHPYRLGVSSRLCRLPENTTVAARPAAPTSTPTSAVLTATSLAPLPRLAAIPTPTAMAGRPVRARRSAIDDRDPVLRTAGM
jgi:hypothetical protein